jgi:hypothetical protein
MATSGYSVAKERKSVLTSRDEADTIVKESDMQHRSVRKVNGRECKRGNKEIEPEGCVWAAAPQRLNRLCRDCRFCPLASGPSRGEASSHAYTTRSARDR